MKIIKNPIIPLNQKFYDLNSNNIIKWSPDSNNSLDFEAISSFISLGFMLDDDTFYKNIKVCKPATEYKLNNKSKIINKKVSWSWNYNPISRSLNDATEEYTEIFERIIKKATKNKKILLPISSGIDSRTLFVPVSKRKDLTLGAYEFEGGFLESKVGEAISDDYNIPLYSQNIQSGYLWSKLETIYQLNNCFTDFTHPRQVNVIDNWKGLGDIILLGHWGDVLFDKQMNSKNISYDLQLLQLKEKILKPGNLELAKELWIDWGIKGSFEIYIADRLNSLYRDINIDHPSARLRAFKSLYWAPRWTSINLSIFNQLGEILTPYYSDEMCRFICSVPEKYLADRQIQINYIKQHCSNIAKIPWQKFYPHNLYNYHHHNYPHNYLYRLAKKGKRCFFKSPEYITRNWELQFLGENNFLNLKDSLLNKYSSNKLISKSIIIKYLDKFIINPVKYASAISMLLTLVVFLDKHYSE